MPQPILEARNVWKRYHRAGGEEVHALRGVSFTLEVGGLAVLTGPSGSGKSTLMALLGALDTPTSGEIVLRGRTLSDVSDAERSRIRRQVGFVFQSCSLLPRLSLWENVSYPLIPLGVRPRERYTRAAELLEIFGLQNRARSRPEELSGGEQQRAAIVRALITNPDVILADEPTSSLDPAAEERVMEHLRRLNASGIALVLVTHSPRATSWGAEVYEVRDGQLSHASCAELEAQTTEQLCTRKSEMPVE